MKPHSKPIILLIGCLLPNDLSVLFPYSMKAVNYIIPSVGFFDPVMCLSAEFFDLFGTQFIRFLDKFRKTSCILAPVKSGIPGNFLVKTDII